MSSEHPGPFDRILQADEPPPVAGDRAFVYVIGTIVGLAVLLLILLLPPISILSRGDDTNGRDLTAAPRDASSTGSQVRDDLPELPPGLVAVSSLKVLSAPEDQRGPSALTIKLNENQTEAQSLALYTYADGKWQRLSDVVLVAGGAAARGEVQSLPGNVAVLKRSRTTLQVAGGIAAGATLDARAGAALTILQPLAFLPGTDGRLVGSPPAVPPAGYKVIPVVVAPDAAIVDDILRSSDLRAAHAAAIADVVKQGNFAGIAIDYQRVNDALAEEFTDFVATLHDALEADGRSLTLILPMPISREGVMTSGPYDWEALGSDADTIQMTAELDQELYFQNTEAALDYVTDNVDPNKIMLSVSALSVERGSDGLRTMPLTDALALASVVVVQSEGDIVPSVPVALVAQNLAETEGASGLHWDEAARAVTFSYPGRGGKRTVWIANAFSAAFRLDLARRYGLGGVVFADVSAEGGGADVWGPVQQLADASSLALVKPNDQLFVPQWSVENGTLAAAEGASNIWTAPAEPGSYDVILTISDGVVRASQRVSVEVAAAGE